MMARTFLAIVRRGPVGAETLAKDARQATGLSIVHDAGTLAILASDDIGALTIDGAGAVIGTVFHRYGPPEAIGQLGADDARSIVATEGQWLIDRCWGSYVAFVSGDAGVHILRDPSAGLLCYRLDLPQMSLFASDAQILREVGWLKPTIDWDELGRGLIFSLAVDKTALTAVAELLPGMSMTIGEESAAAVARWSPWDHINWWEQPTGRSYEQTVRSSVDQAVGAWASVYPQSLMSVSGGLDSSIVAACLAKRRPSLPCITLATHDPVGDERTYARLLSYAIGAVLMETFHSLSDIDISKAVAPHLARPVSRTQALAYDAAIARHADAISANAFFTGNGGDNVLGHSQSAAALYDRYREQGLGFGLWQTLRDICDLTGCSATQALASALRIGRRATPAYRWRADGTFLSQSMLEAQGNAVPSHPWLCAPVDAPPGKAAHIAALLHIQPHLQASERGIGVPIINPLMSQPVMEACLKVPSWEWCKGGVNRSVARSAFADRLPPAILARKDKGGPDGFCLEIIDRYRPEICERLAFGRLAANGLLDRDLLIHALTDDRPDRPVDYMRVLAFLEAEAWIDHWAA